MNAALKDGMYTLLGTPNQRGDGRNCEVALIHKEPKPVFYFTPRISHRDIIIDKNIQKVNRNVKLFLIWKHLILLCLLTGAQNLLY